MANPSRSKSSEPSAGLLQLDTSTFISDSTKFPLSDLERLTTDSTPLISLDSAFSVMIRGNHDLQQAHARWTASREGIRAAWGSFEPRLVGRYNHQETGLPGPLNELKEEYKLSFQGQLPTATQYDVGMRHSNNLYSTTLSEVFAGASLRQPLMRGLLYGGPLMALQSAHAEERKAYHEYRIQLAEAIAKLNSAFWECIYTSQLLHFEEGSVRIARDLLRDGSQRIATGKISPLDLEKLASELAVRLSRKLDAQRMLQDAQNQLTTLLSSPHSPWIGPVRFQLPKAVKLDADRIQTDSLVESFLVWNPEYLAQKSEVRRLEISVNSHRQARLPSIDLIGSAGWYSTARNGPTARHEFEDRPQPQFSGGVEFEIPLAGNLKEAALTQSEYLGLRAAQIHLSQIALKCRKDQKLWIDQIRQFLDQSRQERTTVTYHHRELQSEFQKLAAGKSNYHLLYDIEEKLHDAQKKLLEVIRSYEIGQIELQRSRGLLLRDNSLESLSDDQPLLVDKLLDGAYLEP